MKRLFASVQATTEESAAARSGDDIVASADATMDRAFTLGAAPETVWPWLVQLGKQRAGWYLPQSVERFIPRSRRALRRIERRWQDLDVGDVIPDYGGRHETFEVARMEAPHTLVYVSQRARMHVSWSLTLTPLAPAADGDRTRLHLRLRLGPVRRKWLVSTVGELFDAVTVAGLAAGLRERTADGPSR